MVAADGSQLSPSWTALCQWSLLCPRLRPPFLGPYRSSRAWPPCLNLSSSAGPPKFQRSLESPLRPLLGLHHNQTSPVAQSCFFALSLVLVPRVLPDKSPAGQPPSQGVALGSSPGHSTLQPRLHTTTFTLLWCMGFIYSSITLVKIPLLYVWTDSKPWKVNDQLFKYYNINTRPSSLNWTAKEKCNYALKRRYGNKNLEEKTGEEVYYDHLLIFLLFTFSFSVKSSLFNITICCRVLIFLLKTFLWDLSDSLL